MRGNLRSKNAELIERLEPPMKFKTNKLSLKGCYRQRAAGGQSSALAVTGDTEQPIHIESDTQSLDMRG